MRQRSGRRKMSLHPCGQQHPAFTPGRRGRGCRSGRGAQFLGGQTERGQRGVRGEQGGRSESNGATAESSFSASSVEIQKRPQSPEEEEQGQAVLEARSAGQATADSEAASVPRGGGTGAVGWPGQSNATGSSFNGDGGSMGSAQKAALLASQRQQRRKSSEDAATTTSNDITGGRGRSMSSAARVVRRYLRGN